MPGEEHGYWLVGYALPGGKLEPARGMGYPPANPGRIGFLNRLFRQAPSYGLCGENSITQVLREKWHSAADSWGFEQCAFDSGFGRLPERDRRLALASHELNV